MKLLKLMQLLLALALPVFASGCFSDSYERSIGLPMVMNSGKQVGFMSGYVHKIVAPPDSIIMHLSSNLKFHLWDFEHNRQVFSFVVTTRAGSIYSCDWKPTRNSLNGEAGEQYIALTINHKLYILNLESKKIRKVSDKNIVTYDWFNNKIWFVTEVIDEGSPFTLSCWIHDYELCSSSPIDNKIEVVKKFESGRSREFSFSPNGRLMLCSDGEKRTVTVFDLMQDKQIRVLAGVSRSYHFWMNESNLIFLDHRGTHSDETPGLVSCYNIKTGEMLRYVIPNGYSYAKVLEQRYVWLYGIIPPQNAVFDVRAKQLVTFDSSRLKDSCEMIFDMSCRDDKAGSVLVLTKFLNGKEKAINICVYQWEVYAGSLKLLSRYDIDENCWGVKYDPSLKCIFYYRRNEKTEDVTLGVIKNVGVITEK